MNAGTRVYMALYGAGSCANGLLIMDSTEIARAQAESCFKYVRWLSWCEQQIVQTSATALGERSRDRIHDPRERKRVRREH
jgi:hypothetical protein